MKISRILAAVVLTASLIGMSGCYDYDIHNGGGGWNHWYGGDRFYQPYEEHHGVGGGYEFPERHDERREIRKEHAERHNM